MARFLFWSDLHLEFQDFDIPSPDNLDVDVDAILIAGDTHVKGLHVNFAEAVWDIWRRPVLMIQGNHEGYGAKRLQKILELEDARIPELRSLGADVEILRGTSRIIRDTRVIGATFWTDLMLFSDHAHLTEHVLLEDMKDYKRIRVFDGARDRYRKLRPADTRRMHLAQKRKIFSQLAELFNGPTVVMTHHLPIREMLHPERWAAQELVTAAYASDLSREISAFQVDVWIAGHSHDAVEYRMAGSLGDVFFLRNIRGYENEVTDFDPLRILDSNAPRLRGEAHHEENRHEP